VNLRTNRRPLCHESQDTSNDYRIILSKCIKKDMNKIPSFSGLFNYEYIQKLYPFHILRV
jgi:hypothetical protein